MVDPNVIYAELHSLTMLCDEPDGRYPAFVVQRLVHALRATVDECSRRVGGNALPDTGDVVLYEIAEKLEVS